MNNYYINKRNKQFSTDDRYYGQPGWLACTEEEYFDMKNAAELAALRAENAENREIITDLLMVIGNHTGEVIKCDTVTEEKIITRARRALESSNG